MTTEDVSSPVCRRVWDRLVQGADVSGDWPGSWRSPASE